MATLNKSLLALFSVALMGIFMGYALLALIPFMLLLDSFFLNGNEAAEIGVMYIAFSWPILVVSSLLSAYLAYKKTI
jgi:hypothetical protein